VKRTPSAISNTAMRVDVIKHSDGTLYGTLRTGDVWVWSCDHRHREPGAAHRCVVTEVRRWAASR